MKNNMNKTNYRKLKPLNLTAMLLRLLVVLIKQWPLILVVLVIVSPISPHIRWQYNYYHDDGYKFNCHYMGTKGLVRYARTGDCPLIIWIDYRNKH
jgi:hypothetical protein